MPCDCKYQSTPCNLTAICDNFLYILGDAKSDLIQKFRYDISLLIISGHFLFIFHVPTELGLVTMKYGGRFPRVFGDKFGDKFSDKFGDKFSDSPNLVTNVVTNLVTNLVNHQNR